MMPADVAWKATLGELELQMTKATFNTWLRDARLLACEEDVYIIGVRNDYAKDWLEHRLHDTIARTLSAILARPASLRFVVGSNGNGGMEPSEMPARTGRRRPRKSEEKKGLRLDGGTLNPRYRFSTFVVGTSNRLAHAAALSVAEQPGQTYNPLFIYGGVGLGKTHLLHAIGHRCLERGGQVLYVSSETFTNDLVQSIRAQKMAEFRQKYRTPDVLLIDDIQFIAGKESTQEEVFHTFNDLHSRSRQVVLSSDRPPKAMVTLEERLQSRFEWGLMADIQMPDVETRLAILQAKAEAGQVEVSADVLEVIAHSIHNNIRELEGALNKVIAYAELNGGRIDDRLVSLALADLLQTQEKVTLERVVQTVAEHYHISQDALVSSSRSREVAFPRQMAMYLARTETDASYPQIGLFLGKRDHTTILYGYEKIASQVETDANIRRDILQLKATLYERAVI